MKRAAREALRARIRAIETGAGRGAAARDLPDEVVSLGVSAIDRALPWGGLPRRALHALTAAGGAGGAATGFAAVLVGGFCGAGGEALWCSRPRRPLRAGARRTGCRCRPAARGARRAGGGRAVDSGGGARLRPIRRGAGGGRYRSDREPPPAARGPHPRFHLSAARSRGRAASRPVRRRDLLAGRPGTGRARPRRRAGGAALAARARTLSGRSGASKLDGRMAP